MRPGAAALGWSWAGVGSVNGGLRTRKIAKTRHSTAWTALYRFGGGGRSVRRWFCPGIALPEQGRGDRHQAVEVGGGALHEGRVDLHLAELEFVQRLVHCR